MPRKILSRFLGNEKARTQLLSAIVVALLALTAVTGFFVALPKQASANPATYIYTEDFEDDTVGEKPNASWYMEPWWYHVDGSATMYVSNYNSSSWTQTLHSYDPAASDCVKIIFNLTEDGSTITSGADVEYFQYDIHPVDMSGSFRVHLTSNLDPTTDGRNLSVATTWDRVTGNFQIYNGSSGSYESLFTPTTSGFYTINCSLNFTTHKYKVTVSGDASVSSNWVGFLNASVNNVKGILVQSDTGGSGDYYIDNFTIGTNTELYTGGGQSTPAAPTGASATAYTNFDISLSGLDANSRITFPTAHTNDTSGDIVWANETSYGVLTISNDGVQQINLSWTKGTGATNTVIRRDTTSHATWTLTTGSLLANITDNYYNIGSLSPGTHYYFALWSWNASGYSESYATCDAIVGNASVTNLTVHIEDVGSGTALVPKENFTLYGNASGSYTSLGSFDASTGNITLTTSYAGLPLAIGDKLYFEFKATVGAGAQPDGTYYDNNAQTLDCYVKAER